VSRILSLLRNELQLDDDSLGPITRSMNDAQKTSGNLGKLVLIVLHLPSILISTKAASGEAASTHRVLIRR
jgi:hypothetical protein